MSKMLEKPEIKEKIKKDMEDIVNGVVEKYAGTGSSLLFSPANPAGGKTPE